MGDFGVLIIDESLFFRNWLRRLIQKIPRIQIVGEAKDALSAIHFLRSVKPDAIIIDMKTQLGLGTDLVKIFREISPFSRIIGLTSEDDSLFPRKTSEKAVVFLSKIAEYNKIPEILGSYASAAAC
jgi:DNA-binding NarL/FixJ family response regulator